MTKRGTLNDLDLARGGGGANSKPSAKGGAGTLPLLALDILDERALKGLLPCHYRHDAGSFAWCLAYTCVTAGMEKNGKRQWHHLATSLMWFVNVGSSYHSRITLGSTGLPEELPLRKDTERFATALYHHRRKRSLPQTQTDDLGNPEEAVPESPSTPFLIEP